jgi:hypothetical protein
MLQLDHTSLEVDEISESRPLLEDRLGFRITLTPEAPGNHGRILLDRGYVEVSRSGQGHGVTGGRPPLSAWRGYFLRTADPSTLVSEARAHGVELSEPSIYHGRDGEWDDIEIRRPGLEGLLPLIVRRLTPDEVAADWPPKLAQRHPNGAETLQSVYVLAGDRSEASDLARVLSLLVTGKEPLQDWATNSLLRTMESPQRFPDGTKIIIGYPEGTGIAADWLDHDGPGIYAAGFGTHDLERTEAFLRHNGPTTVLVPGDNSASLWLETAGEPGSRMYFSQI